MMRVNLLYPEGLLDLAADLPPQAADLVRDLGLEIVFSAMSSGDEFIHRVVRHVMLTGLNDTDAIRYRQGVLRDCLAHPEVIRELYRIAVEFFERKREKWLWIGPRGATPTRILHGARELLEEALDLLRELRRVADRNAAGFESAGFRRFFGMIKRELDDDYLELVDRHLRALKFPRGVTLSARLGPGNVGTDYMLCKPTSSGFLTRIFSSGSRSFSYTLPPRDDAGARVLSDLRDRGLQRAAEAVAQAAEHVESFFEGLRAELAFYIGCVNLHEKLRSLGEPICFPEPLPPSERRFFCSELRDLSLILTTEGKVVGNTISAEGKDLVIITGPNKGGKTVFLRSVGLAQLLMQAGMFVPAERFSSGVSSGLFTHFQREEDRSMESGRLEEELKRLNRIVPQLRPGALVLFNESFSSTNEREGSEIATQIVRALIEKGIRVFFVTHLQEFARRFYEDGGGNVLFLRAERLPDGTRTFRIKPGEPLETSHGLDLYRRIFGSDPVMTRQGRG